MRCDYAPIPHWKDPDCSAPKQFEASPMVEVKDRRGLRLNLKYPEMPLTYSINHCFMRREVEQMLQRAADSLPAGFTLMIYDAWRPFLLQKELYEFYRFRILEEYQLQNQSLTEQEAVLRQFVSPPVNDPDDPPVHTTGGAVDLTIADSNGKELSMGTKFDSFNSKARTDYYEQHPDPEITQNRRLLYWTMRKAGFSNLPSEWWHYDYGDKFWAYYSHEKTRYRGVFTREDIYGKA